MAAILLGMAAGFGVARLLGFGDSALQSAIVASLTLAAGSSGRLRTAVPVAGILGLIVVAYSTLGAVTTGYPFAAAIAMAFVAFTTSVMTAAPPVGLLIGMMASYAYFLVTGIGVLEQRAIGGSLSQIGLLGLVGLATGLVLVALRAGIEQRRSAPPRPRAPRGTHPRSSGRCARPCAPSTGTPRTVSDGPSHSASPCTRSRAWGRTTPSG